MLNQEFHLLRRKLLLNNNFFHKNKKGKQMLPFFLIILHQVQIKLHNKMDRVANVLQTSTVIE